MSRVLSPYVFPQPTVLPAPTSIGSSAPPRSSSSRSPYDTTNIRTGSSGSDPYFGTEYGPKESSTDLLRPRTGPGSVGLCKHDEHFPTHAAPWSGILRVQERRETKPSPARGSRRGDDHDPFTRRPVRWTSHPSPVDNHGEERVCQEFRPRSDGGLRKVDPPLDSCRRDEFL